MIVHFADRILGTVFLLVLASLASGQSFVNFEGKLTSPIRLSPDGTRLFAVNPPDNRLSVFDVSNPLNPILIAEIPVGVEPVSVNARDNDEVWVVNEISDSVSVVSVSQHRVIDTLPVKDEPADVVFANGRAFVTAARRNEIAVFDALTRHSITNISVFGENPRSLCVNSNGTRIYAAFALSGNRTTLIPFDQAPPQPAPTNPNLPSAPQASLIVDAADPGWSNVIRYTIPDNDIVEIDSETLAITRYFPRVGTVNFAVAVQPNSGNLYVANTDARNLTRFEPVLRSAFVTNQISRVNITNRTVTRFDLNADFSYSTFPDLEDQTNALAQPTAIAFGPSGNNFFIAAFGSDRIALVDANNGTVLARIDINPDTPGSVASPRTKRGPRGLALKPGQALYVHNRISNTITVINPGTRTVVRELPVGSHDPTPSVVRQGRGFLYDAKLSGNGTVSCASCHIDGEMDMLAWDLGDPTGEMDNVRARVSAFQTVIDFPVHPMKGPMTTQTLRGLNGLDPLHWRGDRTNFTHFNGAFASLLGGSVLSDADMQLYRSFINTIAFPPNPNQNLDRTLPTTFGGGDPVAGRNAFLNTNYQVVLGVSFRCNTCHAVPTGTDRSLTPDILLQEPQSFKVPQLRNVYQKLRFTNAPGAQSLLGFGLVHDGMDPSLFTFLSRPVFGVFANDSVVKRNLEAFVQCFDTGTAPAVGFARTVTASNLGNAALSTEWSVLEAQAIGGTNIDLVVKGTIDGLQRGLLYQPATGHYITDKSGVGPFTRDELIAKIQNGDTLTLMGVPPGSGRRAGIERRPGILDGDLPAPELRIVRLETNVVITWPTNGGFVLESAATLNPTNWTTEHGVRGVIGTEFNLTNTARASRFFRLREL